MTRVSAPTQELRAERRPFTQLQNAICHECARNTTHGRIDAMFSTNYVPGAPAWLDLAVPDVGAAATFYKEVFDWESHETGPEGGGYRTFTVGGKTVAAIGPL